MFQYEEEVVEMLKINNCQNLYNITLTEAPYYLKKYPRNPYIKEAYAYALHNTGNSYKAFQVYNEILSLSGLSEDYSKNILKLRREVGNNPQVLNQYAYVNPEIIKKLSKHVSNSNASITLTITSCKRLSLFIDTVNSFLNCCMDLDLVGEFICIDDNSSTEDRNVMQEMFPFFTYHFKDQHNKGHPQSMNMIQDLVKTPYLFHIEDDWKFFEKRNYLTECLEVLNESRDIKQCLINKNYSERLSDNILGGVFNRTPTGIRYYIHEYIQTSEEKNAFLEKHGYGNTCNYWPHFSFRPSLIKTEIFKVLGRFSETVSHFEMNYSNAYVAQGFKSAFLEGTYCEHIGRLTSERDDRSKLNAYDLNGEAQFSGKESMLSGSYVVPFRFKTFVVNMDNRSDRWEQFQKTPDVPDFLVYQRFSAIDGKRLVSTEQLQRIFDNNDYNMRRGMVGCAMSHLKLICELLNEQEDNIVYCILEDDITFTPNFKEKFTYCCSELAKTNWDMFYLGHHMWRHFLDNEVHSKSLWPKIEQFSREESLKRSMGGTIGYVITKQGARKLLDFINQTGMTNGIDTMQQKSANVLNVYYAYPHLVFSEYFNPNEPTAKLDSDIQFDYDSLTESFESRLERELSMYDNIEEITDFNVAAIRIKNTSNPFYVTNVPTVDLARLYQNSRYPSYMIADKALFVIPKPVYDRYFHRFKKHDVWSVDDAIIYKTIQ